MNPREVIAAGIAHLSQNRLRDGLSILGIFIGIASVLCMIAVGDGAKWLIAKDIEKLGGTNQIRFWTRTVIYQKGRIVRRTTERYTLEDAFAIEATCPEILFALPKNDRFQGYATSHNGGQGCPYLKGVTAVYAQGMNWEVQQGRFFTEIDRRQVQSTPNQI